MIFHVYQCIVRVSFRLLYVCSERLQIKMFVVPCRPLLLALKEAQVAAKYKLQILFCCPMRMTCPTRISIHSISCAFPRRRLSNYFLFMPVCTSTIIIIIHAAAAIVGDWPIKVKAPSQNKQRTCPVCMLCIVKCVLG